ncbi:MAG: FAD:protein FMN transferase, partial [Armatimonadota bacterium]
TREEIETARSLVGARHVLLREQSFAVEFRAPGVEIDLGGIGKGFAIDRAVECLREAGVTRALVHGGTSTVRGLGTWEVAVGGPEPASRGGVDRICRVLLSDSALSVSAVYGRSFRRDGQRYGHVIDPRIGEPVSHTLLAAVWGPSGADCDALSTALLVLGESWLPELSARFKGYDGLAKDCCGGHVSEDSPA